MRQSIFLTSFNNRMQQPVIEQHLDRELQQVGRTHFTIITCHSILLLEHLNCLIHRLLRIRQNETVMSTTFGRLNNGRQRNIFWCTSSSNCMLAEYIVPFPPCSVINSRVNNSCRLIQAASRLIQD